MRTMLIAFAVWVACLLMSCSYAQTPPDAGVLLQQIERSRVQSLPRPGQPELLTPPAPMQGLTGPNVTVRAFRFAGNSLLTETQLTPVVAGFLNHPLGFNELQQAAAIGDTYRDAGWIVRAYLPRQRISDGIVTIQIVEAVFGRTRLEGAPLKRISSETLSAMLDRSLKHGQPVDAAALDRVLLLIDDLPGVSALGSLQEGAGQGETDVTLKVSDKPLLEGGARLDNHGSRSTGSMRGVGNFAFNSPRQTGDQENLDVIHAEGGDFVRLGYLIPLGLAGWRVGAHASRMDYRVVTPDSQT